MTTLNRAELRRLGLTSAGVRELFEQAQTETLAQGCTCGVERIHPSPTNRATRHYAVAVFHAPSCPLHPVNAARAEAEEAKRQARPLARLKRKLSRR